MATQSQTRQGDAWQVARYAMTDRAKDGNWRLGAGSWQLGEHKLEKLAKLGKHARKLLPTDTQGLELKNLSAPTTRKVVPLAKIELLTPLA